MTEGESHQEPEPLALPPPEPAPAAPPRRKRDWVAWLILLLLVIVVLVGSSPFWAPALASLLPWSPRSQMAAAVAPIEQRLDEIARRQAALERQLGPVDEQLQGLAASGGAIHALEQRVTALEERPRGDDAAEVGALQEQIRRVAQGQSENAERIAQLDQRRNAAAGASDDAALLLALGQLRSRLRTSQPFAVELGAVQALAHRDPEVGEALEPLTAPAVKGIPDLAKLTARFERQVVPAAQRETAAPEQEGWGAWLLAKLKSLVRIRPVGETGMASEDPIESALAQAEAALKAGDLAAAAEAAAHLPGPAAESWLATARQRLAAEEAVARATDTVTKQLLQSDRPGAAGER
jgi:hypothetical protein